MKTCIIAIVRHENLYLKEWVDYHLNLGFDNIIICDNNDTDERVTDVIDNDRVIILDYTNIEKVQYKAYTECFLKHKNYYDWLMFIDIDEFVVLEDKYHNSIKEFINDPIFEGVDIIRLHWKVYSTKNDLDVIDGNYNVFDRFKYLYKSGDEIYGKSIIRGSIEYVGGSVQGHGYYDNKKLVAVNARGEKCKNNWGTIGDIPVYDNAWVNHYPTKTIGEYVRQKYFRGGPNADCRRYCNLSYFFKYNDDNPVVRKYGENLIEKLSPTMVKKKYSEYYKNRG